jgi:hypothetical protein
MSKAWARLQWNCIVGSALCVCLFACLNVNTVSCLCPGLNGKDRDRDKKKRVFGGSLSLSTPYAAALFFCAIPKDCRFFLSLSLSFPNYLFVPNFFIIILKLSFFSQLSCLTVFCSSALGFSTGPKQTLQAFLSEPSLSLSLRYLPKI